MAHQDYVSRPRTKNNKKNPYKKKPAPIKESMGLKFKLIGLLTIALIAVSGYFLWSLKDIQPTIEPVIAQPKTEKNNSVQGTKLPQMPEEKWTYVDQLKSKEVEVGKYEVKNGGPYQMQCGSFRTEARAATQKATIAFAGIESQVRQVNGSNGIWYKVILGPYPRKRSAEKDKHKLRSNNVNRCQILSWR
ncbi:MAG: SPOR domain-containing protein [Colwellia sp.]|nr:SPOR domain-containing protein [Colwellia sp.]